MNTNMDCCFAMSPDVAKRIGAIDKAQIEEAVARIEPYKKKRKSYHAIAIFSEPGLDDFLRNKSREGHNFTVVEVMTTPKNQYLVIYYEEE